MNLDLAIHQERDYPQTSVWAVVGNIVGEHAFGVGGSEKRSGTRKFRPGTKVYLLPPEHYWAVLDPDKHECVKVLGQHRLSRDWIECRVRSTYVENWRIRVVYKPVVVSRLKNEFDREFKSPFEWTGDRDTREAVEALFVAWGLHPVETLLAAWGIPKGQRTRKPPSGT